MADNALRVNQEETTQRNTLIFQQYTVVAAKLVILVAEKRDLNGPEPTILPRRIAPCKQAVL